MLCKAYALFPRFFRLRKSLYITPTLASCRFGTTKSGALLIGAKQKMLSKAERKKLERDVGSLHLLPPALRVELEKAFTKALSEQRRQERGEALYETYAGQKDTPNMKMERYRYARHIHNGLVPYVKCTCFKANTNSTSCPFVPDIKLGGLVLELPWWWRHRYSLEHMDD